MASDMALIEQEDFVQLMAKCKSKSNNGYIEGVQDSISGEPVFLGDSVKVDHRNIYWIGRQHKTR